MSGVGYQGLPKEVSGLMIQALKNAYSEMNRLGMINDVPKAFVLNLDSEGRIIVSPYDIPENVVMADAVQTLNNKRESGNQIDRLGIVQQQPNLSTNANGERVGSGASENIRTLYSSGGIVEVVS